MEGELKLRGGQVLNLIAHYPVASSVAALIVALPSAALAVTGQGLAAGVFMGITGLVAGAPIGAMIAADAANV